jgi:hypothetical protein
MSADLLLATEPEARRFAVQTHLAGPNKTATLAPDGKSPLASSVAFAAERVQAEVEWATP